MRMPLQFSFSFADDFPCRGVGMQRSGKSHCFHELLQCLDALAIIVQV